ncbi:MAG: iron complex outerrane recepter protein [Sphingomonadales bacterium]|nr:iron complex outerrane recepter protein [Sphingomonadales bacterium]
MRTLTTALKIGTAFAALTAALPAFAQPVSEPEEQDSATPSEEDGDIVVTARRTEETLQTVPGAVSAFNERALERIQAQDTTGLQGAVPNLNIVQGRGSSNATNIFIRGVGQPDALQTFDPAVGVYVDGVYYSRIRGTQLDLLDLERVEVLRGPQGTLYGKNTIGGALSIVTQRPGQTFRGSAALTYGTYDQLEMRASASGPVSDTISAGFAVLHAERDGYVDDPVLDREYNDRNTQAARGRLAFTPSDRVRVDVIADYSHDDASLAVGQPINSLTYFFGANPPLGGIALALPTDPQTYDFTGRTTPTLPNSTRLRHWGTSMNAAFDLSEAVTLRSITAYRELTTRDYVDIDATQRELGDVFVGVNQNQLSQEFQVNVDSGPLVAVAGLYYLRENITSHQEAYADDLFGPAFGNPTFLRTIDDDLQTTSYAAYANASIEVLSGLRISAGLRYTHENKDYFRTTSTFSNLALLRSATPFNFAREDSWEDVSPMASIDYRFSPNAMIYFRAARGFKSGGFNGRANSPGEASAYEPETMWSYEAGLRTTIAGQLRFNLTGFYNDYRNFQARVSGTDIDPNTGLPFATLGVLNAGELRIQGVELEAAWTPVRGLLIDTQIGYLDAEYQEFADVRFPGGSRAFQTPAFAPDWTIRIGAQYEADLGESGSLTIGGQSRYRSEMALSVDNTVIAGNVGTTTRVEGLFSDPYWIHDARIVWENEARTFSLGLYGQNLFDEAYKTEGQDFSSIGSIRTVYYGAPRTVYVRGTMRF